MTNQDNIDRFRKKLTEYEATAPLDVTEMTAADRVAALEEMANRHSVVVIPAGEPLPQLNEYFAAHLDRQCDLRGFHPPVREWITEFFQWWDLAIDNGLNKHYFMAVFRDSEPSVQAYVNDLKTSMVFDSHWSHLTGRWDLLIFVGPLLPDQFVVTIDSEEWGAVKNSPWCVFRDIMRRKFGVNVIQQMEM